MKGARNVSGQPERKGRLLSELGAIVDNNISSSKGDAVLATEINGEAYSKVRAARERAAKNPVVHAPEAIEELPDIPEVFSDAATEMPVAKTPTRRTRSKQQVLVQAPPLPEKSVSVTWHTSMGPITAEYEEAVVGTSCVVLVLKPKAIQMFVPAVTTTEDTAYPEIEVGGSRYKVINLGHSAKLFGKTIHIFAITE